MTDRAVLFVDGNNFYHGLREERVKAIGNVSLAKVSAKIVAPREPGLHHLLRWTGLAARQHTAVRGPAELRRTSRGGGTLA